MKYIYIQYDNKSLFFRISDEVLLSKDELPLNDNVILYFFNETYLDDKKRNEILDSFNHSVTFLPIESYFIEQILVYKAVFCENETINCLFWSISNIRLFKFTYSVNGIKSAGKYDFESLGSVIARSKQNLTISKIVELNLNLKKDITYLNKNKLIPESFKGNYLNKNLSDNIAFNYTSLEQYLLDSAAKINQSGLSAHKCIFIGNTSILSLEKNEGKLINIDVINPKESDEKLAFKTTQKPKLYTFNQPVPIQLQLESLEDGTLQLPFPIFIDKENLTDHIESFRYDFFENYIVKTSHSTYILPIA